MKVSKLVGFIFIIFLCEIYLVTCAKYQTPRAHVPEEPVVYPYDYCQYLGSNKEFDYVVIGAGPAGATVARRLAENPRDQVLLIEAGDDPRPESDLFTTKPTPQELWTFKTKPSNKICTGYRNRQCVWKLGKVLGGCSVINGEMYIRGNHQDYEDWKSKGNPGWGWKDMFPYFLKLENFHDPDNKTHADPAYHSKKGPLTTFPRPLEPHSEEMRMHIVEAIAAMGLPKNSDVNGKSQIGFGTYTATIEENGYRNNAAKSYLLNIPDNLKVCKKTLVNRLILSENKIVERVEVVRYKCKEANSTICKSGKRYTVKARKDYILTAGPLNTPQILERSGIGDKSVLTKAKVPLFHELKGVGNNLQEHLISLCGLYELTLNNSVALNPLSKELSMTGFLNMANYLDPVPDVQFYFTAATSFLKSGNLNDEIEKQISGISRDIFAFGTAILRQTNPGFIHITSADPRSMPDLDASQFTSKRETNLAVKSCRLVRKIMTHPKLVKFKPKPITLEKCKQYAYNSVKEIMCVTRMIPGALYHFAGTATMGPASDDKSVVDSRLRVHGINNLRIADLSVMPAAPRGNTEIPTIAVAERAADIIKKANKK